MDLAVFKDVMIEPLDTSHKEGRYLLCSNGRHYEVSFYAAVLAGLPQQGYDSWPEIAVRFSEITGESCTEQAVEKAAEKLFSVMDFRDGKAKGRQHQFLFRTELLHPTMVRNIADRLKFLYRFWVAVPAVCAIAIFEILFYTGDLGMIRTLDGSGWIVIIAVLGLFVLNSLFHEFGHAAACRYFDADNGDVGFGLYLTFPVFYSDVTSVWKLNRRERIVVNFGGVYFQSIFLIPFFIAYFLTGNDLCKLYIYATNMNFIFTLNPFLKFDGYWIMSDILGVPNLRQRSMEYVRALFGKDRRRKISESFLSGVKPAEKVIAVIYSVISTGFFLYFFVYAIPLMIYRMLPETFSDWKSIIVRLSQGTVPEAGVIIGNTISLVLLGFMMFFIVRSVVSLSRRLLRRSR